MTEQRIECLEQVADRSRIYLEVLTTFLLREQEEGRGAQHAISPRVANATKELMFALRRLDEVSERVPV